MKPVYVNGLRQVITHKKTKGYEIHTFTCVKCGAEKSFKKDDILDKCACGGKLRLKDIMDEKTVAKILSRSAKYICPVCDKTYLYPADCCLAREKYIKELLLEYNLPDRMTRGLI